MPYIEYALHNEVLSEEDTILEEINRVIDLKLLCDEGKGVIWDSSKNLIRKDYTKTEYRRYLFSYIKLIFMHPQDFLRVQIPVVLQANGMCSSGQFIESTENLYTNEGNYSTETIGEIFFRHDFTRPVSVNLRKNVITILETLEVNKFLWLLHKITYNAFIPILGLIFIIVWCFRKKLYLISGILCSSLIKIPILILSIPGTAFMYWYPNYLVAWTVVIIFLIYQLKHIINIRKEKHKNEQ